MDNRRTKSAHYGTKLKLIAEFDRYSKFDFERRPRCVDLINIAKENGKIVSHRRSVRSASKFEEAGNLQRGDLISFYGWVIDGKVSHPTRVTILKAHQLMCQMPFENVTECL